MNPEFGPNTVPVEAFLKGLETLTDEQWNAVAAITPACRAAFGDVDQGQVEGVLRAAGLWESVEKALTRAFALNGKGPSVRGTQAGLAVIPLVGGKKLPEPWFRAMYAPFARTIELGDLPANDYPDVPDPPDSQEERFAYRLQALTQPEWGDVETISDWSIKALGEDQAFAASRRALDAMKKRMDLDPDAGHQFERASSTFLKFFESGGPYGEMREIWGSLARRFGHEQSWAEQAYTERYGSRNQIAEQVARHALLAIAGMSYVSDADFSFLYLPFCTGIRFGSLLTD
jgi:hypothetical protein